MRGKKLNVLSFSIIVLLKQILDLTLVLCSVRWILNIRQRIFKNFKLELSFRAALLSNVIGRFSPTKRIISFDGTH